MYLFLPGSFMKRILAVLFCASALSFLPFHTVRAQNVSFETNLVDWASVCTINADVGVSVSRHFSLHLGGRYNNLRLRPVSDVIPEPGDHSSMEIRNRQKVGYFGIRYWPWYVYSGWWIQAKAQHIDFSNTGFGRPALKEGRGGNGGGLSAGYTLMLGKHLNLDLGAGFWAGHFKDLTVYDCPRKEWIRRTGPANVIYPDSITVGIMYTF